MKQSINFPKCEYFFSFNRCVMHAKSIFNFFNKLIPFPILLPLIHILFNRTEKKKYFLFLNDDKDFLNEQEEKFFIIEEKKNMEVNHQDGMDTAHH